MPHFDQSHKMANSEVTEIKMARDGKCACCNAVEPSNIVITFKSGNTLQVCGYCTGSLYDTFKDMVQLATIQQLLKT